MAERVKVSLKVVDDPVAEAMNRFATRHLRKQLRQDLLPGGGCGRAVNYRRTDDGWEHWDIVDEQGNKVGSMSASREVLGD